MSGSHRGAPTAGQPPGADPPRAAPGIRQTTMTGKLAQHHGKEALALPGRPISSASGDRAAQTLGASSGSVHDATAGRDVVDPVPQAVRRRNCHLVLIW